MLISHRKKFIYLKTKKTAGTSVIRYFEPYCVAEGAPLPKRTVEAPTVESEAGLIGYYWPDPSVASWWNHMPAELVKDRLGEVWDRYTKFCCIRNPFDKVFSYFWYSNPDFAKTYSNADQSEIRGAFRAWVLSDQDFARDREMYTIKGGPPCLDVYIRYESLEADLQAVCARFGVDYERERLGWRKGEHRPRGLSCAQFYDPDTTARVQRAYDREFEWFEYAPNPEG